MSEITYREALRRALQEEMRRDSTVIVMGEDVVRYGATYGVTKGLADEFGEERIRDTPIAESAIVGAAIGAAMGGLRPVAELMTINFSLLALDQIVNEAAKIHSMFGGQSHVPMVVRTPSGWGQLGATHSQTFENYFAYVPGLIVVAPSTPYDAKGLLKSAIRDENPVIFIEHQQLYSLRGDVPDEEYTVPLGRSVVRRTGQHVTLISYSRMGVICQQAAEKLAGEGIEAEIIDLRTLRPLDLEIALESVRKTNHVVIAEEGWRTMGMGAEIAARITEEAFDDLDAPVARVAAVETPLPYSRPLELLAMPNEDSVIQAVRNLVRPAVRA